MGRITEITKKQAVPRIVERAAAAVANSQNALFTITGNIIITNIIGEVVTLLETKTTNLKLTANPTVGADVDICANLDATAAAVGSTLNITGTLANAMVKLVNGAGVPQAAGVLVHAGTLDLVAGAANTGTIKWTLHYLPVGQSSSVVVA